MFRVDHLGLDNLPGLIPEEDWIPCSQQAFIVYSFHQWVGPLKCPRFTLLANCCQHCADFNPLTILLGFYGCSFPVMCTEDTISQQTFWYSCLTVFLLLQLLCLAAPWDVHAGVAVYMLSVGVGHQMVCCSLDFGSLGFCNGFYLLQKKLL